MIKIYLFSTFIFSPIIFASIDFGKEDKNDINYFSSRDELRNVVTEKFPFHCYIGETELDDGVEYQSDYYGVYGVFFNKDTGTVQSKLINIHGYKPTMHRNANGDPLYDLKGIIRLEKKYEDKLEGLRQMGICK